MTNLRTGPGLTRRRLLQITGGGIAISGLGLRTAMAEPYDRAFTWISPRGTLEVLDDESPVGLFFGDDGQGNFGWWVADGITAPRRDADHRR